MFRLCPCKWIILESGDNFNNCSVSPGKTGLFISLGKTLHSSYFHRTSIIAPDIDKNASTVASIHKNIISFSRILWNLNLKQYQNKL